MKFQQLDQCSQKKLKLNVLSFLRVPIISTFILLSVFPGLVLAEYTQNDLDVLVSQKEYTEYFSHAKDILPTQRTKKWKSQLIQTAQNYIKELMKNDNFGAQHRQWVTTISKWSTLKSNNGFMQLFDRYKIESFKKQIKLKSSEIENFWVESTQSSKTAFDLTRTLYAKRMHIPFPILQKVTHGPVSTFYCREADIQNILQNHFEKVVSTKPKAFKLEKEKLVNSECLKQWAPKLIKNLQSDSLLTTQTAYYLLHSENLISKEQEELFLVNYFLTGPRPGKILNYAWNLVSELGKDYKRRWKLLKKLKKQRFLTGGLFTIDDNQRRSGFLQHLETNFPEYIDLYIRTCSDFYGGIGSFPYGNPTAECQKFMSNNQNYKFIPTALILNYNKIRMRY